MLYFLNCLYLLLLLAASPWLAYKALTTGKYRQGMVRKLFGLTPFRTSDNPCVWFHAVSVGEVLLLKQVIARFRQRHPDWDCVLSTTTNTGFDVAKKTYPDVCVYYWPLDFTWAVKRALNRIRPQLIVLAELEVWPNFIATAKKRGCTLAVINGRMSPKSYRGYSRIRPFMSWLLKKIDVLAAQNQDYADRLLSLGAPPDRVSVTGSVKYDGVTSDRENARTVGLGRLFQISRRGAENAEDDSSLRSLRLCEKSLVWVVGSTQPPEEENALNIYRKAKTRFPGLQLILVPRHKERFEEVAGLLESSGLPFVRRSKLSENSLAPADSIILLDTLGELGAVWGLADVAFVGGSIFPKGGQNMIEPAAYGAAVTFGPHVWNFQETVDRLLENKAAVQVQDADELERQTLYLLEDAAARTALGQAAQQFIRSQQGAAERTLDLLDRLIEAQRSRLQAA